MSGQPITIDEDISVIPPPPPIRHKQEPIEQPELNIPRPVPGVSMLEINEDELLFARLMKKEAIAREEKKSKKSKGGKKGKPNKKTIAMFAELIEANAEENVKGEAQY